MKKIIDICSKVWDEFNKKKPAAIAAGVLWNESNST